MMKKRVIVGALMLSILVCTPTISYGETTLATQSPSPSPSPSPFPVIEATPTPKPVVEVKKGKSYLVNGLWYRVTGKTTVCVTKPQKRNILAVTIPATVKILRKTFKVTTIGAKAFYRCSKLKRITIKSKSIKKIGSKAFLKIKKRPQIQVPKSSYRKHLNLLYLKKDWNAYVYYKSLKIVSTKDSRYDYQDMVQDITELTRGYGDLMQVSSIGRSYDGRTLYCIRLGSASARKQVVISAGIHAREWRNCHFLMEKLEYLVKNYDEKIYRGKTVQELLKGTCLYILPMVNPDGTAISQYGPKSIQNATLRKKLMKMHGIKQYSRWKANARGVDLNRNFNTGWASKADKKKKPCSELYPGDSAASEIETKCLSGFMNRLSNPQVMVSYHSTGEIIYYDYGVTGNLKTKNDYYASLTQKLTHYSLIHGSSGTVANGGFGDWCAYVRRVPTVTIESGTVACPLPFSQMPRLRSRNKYIIEAMLLGK